MFRRMHADSPGEARTFHVCLSLEDARQIASKKIILEVSPFYFHNVQEE